MSQGARHPRRRTMPFWLECVIVAFGGEFEWVEKRTCSLVEDTWQALISN